MKTFAVEKFDLEEIGFDFDHPQYLSGKDILDLFEHQDKIPSDIEEFETYEEALAEFKLAKNFAHSSWQRFWNQYRPIADIVALVSFEYDDETGDIEGAEDLEFFASPVAGDWKKTEYTDEFGTNIVYFNIPEIDGGFIAETNGNPLLESDCSEEFAEIIKKAIEDDPEGYQLDDDDEHHIMWCIENM